MTLTDVGVRSVLRKPVAVRWLGFAGSVLLAIAAYVGGAFPTLVPNANPVTIFQRPEGPLLYGLWIAGTLGLVSAWWLGRRFIGTGVLNGRWVAVTAALWMLPMLLCPPTGSRDVYAYACQGALVAAGHSPYQEGVSALPCQWLDSVSPIWRDTPAPYGPLFLMVAGAAAKVGSLTAAIVFFRLAAVIGVIVIAACLPVLARHVGVPVDRALWLVLACPLVIVDLIGGAHNDALTIGLLLAGLAVIATRKQRMSALVVGGVLIGLSISVKTTMGAMLPFAALFAAGGPQLPALGILLRKALAVMGAALATLLGLSVGSGLGVFGWITALEHAGDSVVWTSPPTAVGLAIGYVGRLFGTPVSVVDDCRLVALIAMPFVLLLILWHSRNHNPLYGAGLALLATIFLAPVVQVWYLVWPLALFAATKARTRWYLVAIVFGSCIVLPDGSGMTKFLQLPMSFIMTGIVVWTIIRGFTWLRGFEPTEIDFDAIRVKPLPVGVSGPGDAPRPVGVSATRANQTDDLSAMTTADLGDAGGFVERSDLTGSGASSGRGRTASNPSERPAEGT